MKAEDINPSLEEVLSRVSPQLGEKIKYSVNLLRKAEKLMLAYDAQNGAYLAFSGGKDSQALYHVAKLAGVKFKAHFSPTSVDPAPLIRFIRTNYPSVEFEKLKYSIFERAVQRQILPTMRVRWCCKDFKENAGAGKVTLIGIRHAESARRATRNEVEISNRQFSGTLEGLDEYRKQRENNKRVKKNTQVTIVNANGETTSGCINGKDSLLISPIIQWTEDDVWEFIKKGVQVPYCSLYDKGHTRIGCILCPMSSKASKQRDIKMFPHVKEKWIQAIMAIRAGKAHLYDNQASTPPQFADGYIWHGCAINPFGDTIDFGERRNLRAKSNYPPPKIEHLQANIWTQTQAEKQSPHERASGVLRRRKWGDSRKSEPKICTPEAMDAQRRRLGGVQKRQPLSKHEYLAPTRDYGRVFGQLHF